VSAGIALVAAHDDAFGIGRDGDIPWRIPADFALFRRLTMGHVLVVGRRTLESLPRAGLPGRRIVCVTAAASLPGAASCAPNLGTALSGARELAGPGGRIFVAGGAGLYGEALAVADEAWVTQIPGRHGCDRFFPDLAAAGWRVAETIPLEGAVAARWLPPR